MGSQVSVPLRWCQARLNGEGCVRLNMWYMICFCQLWREQPKRKKKNLPRMCLFYPVRPNPNNHSLGQWYHEAGSQHVDLNLGLSVELRARSHETHATKWPQQHVRDMLTSNRAKLQNEQHHRLQEQHAQVKSIKTTRQKWGVCIWNAALKTESIDQERNINQTIKPILSIMPLVMTSDQSGSVVAWSSYNPKVGGSNPAVVFQL